MSAIELPPTTRGGTGEKHRAFFSYSAPSNRAAGSLASRRSIAGRCLGGERKTAGVNCSAVGEVAVARAGIVGACGTLGRGSLGKLRRAEKRRSRGFWARSGAGVGVWTLRALPQSAPRWQEARPPSGTRSRERPGPRLPVLTRLPVRPGSDPFLCNLFCYVAERGMRLVQRSLQLVVDSSSGAGIFTFLNPRAKIYPQGSLWGKEKCLSGFCHNLKTDFDLAVSG